MPQGAWERDVAPDTLRIELPTGGPEAAGVRPPRTLTPADVLTLQGAIGNQRVGSAIARSALTAPTIQRAPHRPAPGDRIEFEKKTWNVITSTQQNDMIQIRQGTHTRNIDWRTSDFWIIRPDTEADQDLRARASEMPTDRFGRSSFVKTRFQEARAAALAKIKAFAKPKVQESHKREFGDLTLADFEITKRNPSAEGGQTPSEWMLHWKEGARRTWKFMIDSDDPPPESTQEPHVGWEASATGDKTENDVERQLGHIWLNEVPVSRGGLQQ